MKQNPRNPLRLFLFCLRRILPGVALHALTAPGIRAAAAGVGEADDAAIVFSGVMSAHGRTLVALTDRASGLSRWVAPDEEFAGYRLSAYDGETDAVILIRNQQRLRLSLKKPHVQTAIAPEIAGMTRERQLMVWARVRELDGDNLVSALIASGNAELKVLADAHQQRVREATASRQALARITPGRNDDAETRGLRQAYAASVQQEESARARLQQEALLVKQALQQRIDQ